MRRLLAPAGLLFTTLLFVSCADERTQPTDPELGADGTTTANSTTIRGRNWIAPLRMEVELPIPTPPTGPPAIGTAGFQVSTDQQSIFYQLVVARITNVLMAHIHLAPPGQTGPVVVWLYPSGPPPQLIPGQFSGVLGEGTITAANLVGPLAGQPLSALLQQIQAGNAYVNVHTQLNQPGEIRGQIFRIQPPDPAVQ